MAASATSSETSWPPSRASARAAATRGPVPRRDGWTRLAARRCGAGATDRASRAGGGRAGSDLSAKVPEVESSGRTKRAELAGLAWVLEPPRRRRPSGPERTGPGSKSGGRLWTSWAGQRSSVLALDEEVSQESGAVTASVAAANGRLTPPRDSRRDGRQEATAPPADPAQGSRAHRLGALSASPGRLLDGWPQDRAPPGLGHGTGLGRARAVRLAATERNRGVVGSLARANVYWRSFELSSRRAASSSGRAGDF